MKNFFSLQFTPFFVVVLVGFSAVEIVLNSNSITYRITVFV